MADFLLEIGTEEIPARMIDAAREELQRRVSELITRERLAEQPQLEAFSTPRRLAVLARGLAEKQADVDEVLTGPSAKVAFKDGAPTAAAEAFAKKAGVPLSALERATTPKGEYISAKVRRAGRAAGQILSDELPREIAALYWPKNMYWRAGKPERFVRPVRWLVALLDGQPVPLEFGGTHAAQKSRGHRILYPMSIRLDAAANYQQALAAAMVIASPADRDYAIRKALDRATRKVAGARWREDSALLNKVVNLTEFPSVILGNFDPEFLALPEEVLVTVMRDHQNYFAVEDAAGKLAPHFLAVLNTDGDPEGLIRHGHERVLRARFKDAQFFWQSDQKVPLQQRVEILKSVTFQKDLGSYYAKAKRTAALARRIAEDLEQSDVKLDGSAIEQSAWLAKTDLTTELVKEFTELQGVVGGLYARAQGLPDTVANAIYDHYKPESMDAAVPRSREGAVVALADKADSIAGMFALGLQPTGSKDPFALRRQGNGIVKIIAEHGLRLSLHRLMAEARANYAGADAEKKFVKPDQYASALDGFFRERVEFYLRETLGFAYDEVSAVLAAGSDDVVDALARTRALAEVRQGKSDDFAAIASSFKRIKNILRQASEAKKSIATSVDSAALQEPAEKQLHALIEQVAPQVESLRKQGNYAPALAHIAGLRPAVDAFFDHIMVMVEDERLRANRLALLDRLLREFSSIADFSEIVTERK